MPEKFTMRMIVAMLLVTVAAGEGNVTKIESSSHKNDTATNGTETEIENRSLFSITSRASQGCRSYQGGVGRCVPYSECGVSFENEFISRNSLCGFSNRRPLVCCPHDTYGYEQPSYQQPFFPNFQQNFFQQNPFANSFFFNPQQSYYNQPSANRGYFQSPYGSNNGGGNFGFNNGFNSNPYGYQQPSQFQRPNYEQPTYVGQVRPQNPSLGLPNFQRPNTNQQPLPNNQNPGYPQNNGQSTFNTGVNERSCGLTNATTIRIVGGKEAAVGAWPWLALLFVDVSGNGYRAPLCGGALINKDHILTAAHCVNLMGNVIPASRFTVRLGEHDYLATDDGANPVDVDVTRVFSHPDFNNRTYFNDIAILRLSQPVPYGHGVAPICVPDTSGDDSEYKGRSASVAGWGELYYAGPASSILQETTIPIQSLEQCKESFKRTVIKFNEKYLCAGSLQGDRDTCRGDSGGPLMLLTDKGRYSVIGVTSFGRKCAEKGYPGSYTRVAKYTDWMNGVISSR